MRRTGMVLEVLTLGGAALLAGACSEDEPTAKKPSEAQVVGTGGGPQGSPCTTVEDCPGEDSVCAQRACDQGHCAVHFAARGLPAGEAVLGDCRRTRCDGEGFARVVPDSEDVPKDEDAKECMRPVCKKGDPVSAARTGEPCTENGGRYCGENGECVQCSEGKHCDSGVCFKNACADPTCADKVRNGVETDVDCGGGQCPTCDGGKACNSGSDCVSTVCTEGKCEKPSCTDQVKNGAETDIDCGGSCDPCPNGKTCSADADCKSSDCRGGACEPSCTDGVRGEGETGVDCGGAKCPACEAGETCASDADCADHSCAQGTCRSCSDGKKNGSETDVDCGGECASCNLGKLCVCASDCGTGHCCPGIIGTEACSLTACEDPCAGGTAPPPLAPKPRPSSTGSTGSTGTGSTGSTGAGGAAAR